MTVAEAARALNVCVETIRRMCRTGQLPHERNGSGRNGEITIRPESGPMSVKQAAARLKVTPKVVYRLCEAGKLGHVRVGSKRGVIRITDADLDEYLKAKRALPLGDRDHITLSEAARKHGVSVSTLYRLCATGVLTSRLAGPGRKTLRVDRREAEAYFGARAND